MYISKRKTVAIALLLFALSVGVQAQQPAAQSNQTSPHASLYQIPPRILIDCPTAGTLPRGNYDLVTRVFADGGAILRTDIGFVDRLQMGISYGGEQIFSRVEPTWNPSVEFSIKLRIIDELQVFPAVAIGFSSQGYGVWSDTFDRYEYKSRGFYAVMSRSFFLYNWTSSWHLGANYSLEKKVDEDADVNFFLGYDATFQYNIALLLEYDVALNDDRSSLPDGSPYPFAGKGRGYLNASLKWLFRDHLQLELLLKDILQNRRSLAGEDNTIVRELRLTFTDGF